MALRPDQFHKPATHAEGFEKAYAHYHPHNQLRAPFHNTHFYLPAHLRHLPHAHKVALVNQIESHLRGMNFHNHGLVSPGLANALQNWHAANGRMGA